MITGILAAFIYILLITVLTVGRIRHKKDSGGYGNIYKALGIILVVISVFHMITVWPLIGQRPLSMYISGLVLTGCTFTALLSYLFRDKLKKNWLPIYRIASLIILPCIVFHVFIGINSLNAYNRAVDALEIHDMDYSRLADGDYIGEADVGYIYARVIVHIRDKQIESIILAEHRHERGEAAQAIINSIITQQSIEVDAVTGATNSSKVILKAVENALSGTAGERG